MSPESWSGYFDKATLAAMAGALGGAVRWMTLRERWPDGLISVAVGGIVAYFFAWPLEPVLVAVTMTGLNALEPVIGPVVLSPDRFSGPSGFLTGLGGMTIAGLGLDFWKILKQRSKIK